MNWKQALGAVVLSSVILTGTAVGGQHAEASGIVIWIDGDLPKSMRQATVSENTVLVPMRGIFEALGATIKWDQKTQTVQATKGDQLIQLKVGESTATVNGKKVQLAVKAQVQKEAVFVPLRFVSEALGAKVTWDQSAQAIGINSLGDDWELGPKSKTTNTEETTQSTKPRKYTSEEIQALEDAGNWEELDSYYYGE